MQIPDTNISRTGERTVLNSETRWHETVKFKDRSNAGDLFDINDFDHMRLGN